MGNKKATLHMVWFGGELYLDYTWRGGVFKSVVIYRIRDVENSQRASLIEKAVKDAETYLAECGFNRYVFERNTTGDYEADKYLAAHRGEISIRKSKG